VYLKFFKQKKETRTAAEIAISVFNGARQSYDVKLSVFGCLAYSVYPHIITHFFMEDCHMLLLSSFLSFNIYWLRVSELLFLNPK
jgi:hypothetical protein